MRKLRMLGLVLGILGVATVASARDSSRVRAPKPQLLPYSNVSYQAPPPPGGAAPKAAPSVGAPALFQCVKYDDLDNVHPCAVTKIVKIVDPCWKPCRNRCGCCNCAPPRCVFVKICVPPCGCLRVKCSRDGRKVRYDYGKYAVDVTSRNGKIKVDYDD